MPLLSGDARDQVARGLQGLVSRFLPEPENTRKGVFGRLRAGAR